MDKMVLLIGGPLDGQRVPERPGGKLGVVVHGNAGPVVHVYAYGSPGLAFYRHSDATAYWPNDIRPHSVRYYFSAEEV